jgi:hypothetical protein
MTAEEAISSVATPFWRASESDAMTDRDSTGGAASSVTSSDGEARSRPSAEVLELLDWLAREPRTHRETIETWGSHCPRITPWEEAQESGLVQVTRRRETDGRLAVVLTRSGHAALAVSRRTSVS